jgi:hypothetical protein
MDCTGRDMTAGKATRDAREVAAAARTAAEVAATAGRMATAAAHMATTPATAARVAAAPAPAVPALCERRARQGEDGPEDRRAHRPAIRPAIRKFHDCRLQCPPRAAVLSNPTMSIRPIQINVVHVKRCTGK